MEDAGHTSEERKFYLETNTVAAELERLSAAAVIAMSRRDWSFNKSPEAKEVLEHIDPDWTADFDNYPKSLTFPEQITAHRQLFAEHPLSYYELGGITSHVDEATGIGSVYLEVDIKGPDNLIIRGLSEFRWRRDGVKWLWFYNRAMRGIALDGGLDLL